MNVHSLWATQTCFLSRIAGVTGSVAWPALSVRRGKVKEPSRFLPFLLNFSSFFWFFPDFWQIFRCQGWHSAPPCHPSGYATAQVEKPWSTTWQCCRIANNNGKEHKSSPRELTLDSNNFHIILTQNLWKFLKPLDQKNSLVLNKLRYYGSSKILR